MSDTTGTPPAGSQPLARPTGLRPDRSPDRSGQARRGRAGNDGGRPASSGRRVESLTGSEPRPEGDGLADEPADPADGRGA